MFYCHAAECLWTLFTVVVCAKLVLWSNGICLGTVSGVHHIWQVHHPACVRALLLHLKMEDKGITCVYNPDAHLKKVWDKRCITWISESRQTLSWRRSHIWKWNDCLGGRLETTVHAVVKKKKKTLPASSKLKMRWSHKWFLLVNRVVSTADNGAVDFFFSFLIGMNGVNKSFSLVRGITSLNKHSSKLFLWRLIQNPDT